MIAIRSERHAAELFQHLRHGRGWRPEDLAARIYVSPRTIRGRERGDQGYTGTTLIDTARAFGFTVALLPAGEPGRRPTGTGWPA